MADGINRPDADEEFDRLPRQPKKSGNGPLIAMMIVGLLLIGGLIFALVYFLGGSSNLDREMMAYLPADTDILYGVEVEELMKNDKVKEMFKKAAESEGENGPINMMKGAGVSEEDVSRILVGGSIGSSVNGRKAGVNDEPPMSIVVRFKKAVDKAKIANFAKATEQTKNGKTYYRPAKKDAPAIYFPSDTMLVLAFHEKHLDSLMTKDPSQVVVSEEMQELGRKMSKGQIWLAVKRSAFGDNLKGISEQKHEAIPSDLLPAIEGMKGAGVYLKLDGDKFSVGASVLCADSTAAKKASEGLQKWIGENLNKPLDQHKLVGEQLREMEKKQQDFLEEVRKSVKADHSGDMLEVSLGFSIGGLEELVKGFMDQFMGKMEVRIQHDAEGKIHQDHRPIDLEKRKFESRPKIEGPKKSPSNVEPDEKGPKKMVDPKENESKPTQPPK